MTFKPQQIIPATSWFAVYDEENGEVQRVPLICWALGDDHNGKRVVCGMVMEEAGDIIPASSLPNFSGYDLEVQEFELDAELLN